MPSLTKIDRGTNTSRRTQPSSARRCGSDRSLPFESLEHAQLMAVDSPISNYNPGQTFYENNGSSSNSYWANVPASYDKSNNTPVELFVWSHGCGGQSKYDTGTFASQSGGPSYITIGLDGREGGCWSPGTDAPRIMAAIDDVARHFNIDKQRVVVGGYSSGGDLSYNVAFNNSTRIAGILACNTTPFRDADITQAQALKAPFHFQIVQLSHTSDNTYPLATVQSELGAVRAAGSNGDGWASSTLIERPGTHFDQDTANSGTNYDIKTYLLPKLGNGWKSGTTNPTPPTQPTPPTTGITATATFKHGTNWSGNTGFNGSIVVKNTGSKAISGWKLEFDFAGGIHAGEVWNGSLVSQTGTHYVIQNTASNATLAAGQSVEVFFNVYGGTTQANPTNYKLNGVALNQPAAPSVKASFSKGQAWAGNTGYNGSITLTNTGSTAISGWTFEFDFTGTIHPSEIWNAQFVSQSGNHYVFKSTASMPTIAAGQQLQIFFNVYGGTTKPAPTNYKLNGVALAI